MSTLCIKIPSWSKFCDLIISTQNEYRICVGRLGLVSLTTLAGVFGLIIYYYYSINIYISGHLYLHSIVGILTGIVSTIFYLLNLNSLGDVRYKYTSNIKDIRGIKVSYDSEDTLKIEYTTGKHDITLFITAKEPIIKSNKYIQISMEYLEQIASLVNKMRMEYFWRTIFMGSRKANYYLMVPSTGSNSHYGYGRHSQATSTLIIDGPATSAQLLATCRVQVAIFKYNRFNIEPINNTGNYTTWSNNYYYNGTYKHKLLLNIWC